MYTYTSEDYDTMGKMTEEQLAQTWREDCTAEDYEKMQENYGTPEVHYFTQGEL